MRGSKSNGANSYREGKAVPETGRQARTQSHNSIKKIPSGHLIYCFAFRFMSISQAFPSRSAEHALLPLFSGSRIARKTHFENSKNTYSLGFLALKCVWKIKLFASILKTWSVAD